MPVSPDMVKLIVETIVDIAIRLIALLPPDKQDSAVRTVGVRLIKRNALRQEAQALLNKRKKPHA
jgi:hypothetical protein